MNIHDPDEKLISDVIQQLDSSIDNLDEDVTQRLKYSRKQAVNSIFDSNRGLLKFLLNPAATFAALSLIIVTASIILITENRSNLNDDAPIIIADYNIEDDDIISEYELLSDLEFISWLIEQEYKVENDNS